ncbi:MAG TPA: hypothetical protein VF733_00430 [Candidatus Saccharimonadales bacterium]
MPGGNPLGVQPAGPQPAVPSYATDPRSLLAASGNLPQQAAVQNVPMPAPPPPGQPGMAGPAGQPPQVYGQPGAQAAPAPSVRPQQGISGVAPGAPGVAGPGTKPAIPAVNPNSTQNMLQIAEIRDGIVIMNDGSFRSVIMVNSINFDLMSRSEQEAVEFNYQNFLNSLFFPVQIFVRSQKVDMGPYIEKLDRVRSEHDNMLLALLMDDYIDYIEALAQQTNIMDKKFYIVIPFFPHVSVQKTFTQSKNFLSGMAALFSKQEDHVVINEDDLEKAKSELRNRVQTVLDGLLACNIQSLPLDTQELIELYYDTYNPDTATRQQLKNFGDMNADIVTKGTGIAPQPHLEREMN